ncbi:MAG: alpha-ketoglutarate-dependent dioxygenase AlkB [Alphaproteobacteria bacterium]|nr:alpha-ketoglutarate-dependent dioxygenase AlkB [Alphaproteobacteria bacterium]
MQAELFTDASSLPQGFCYQLDLITAGEEAALAEWISALPLKPFEFHGYTGSRRVVSFGYHYDYQRRAVEDAASFPFPLLSLRQKIAGFAGRPPQTFVQALVTEYAPGSPIGWHRDKKEFGEVVGVSLLSSARLRFRRQAGAGWERREQLLAPRSSYLLSGDARQGWEHSIPPQQELRYSITFRTLAK